jgi:hypothetical protein
LARSRRVRRTTKDSTQNLVDWIKTGKQPAADTQTTGELMVRADWLHVRKELGIQAFHDGRRCGQ